MNEHHCHAIGCEVPVPPNLFMCKRHWYKLPMFMRDAVWDAYVPGQEVRKDPSPKYLLVAADAQRWLAAAEIPDTIIPATGPGPFPASQRLPGMPEMLRQCDKVGTLRGKEKRCKRGAGPDGRCFQHPRGKP
jgi:hypothetical protein